MILNVIMVILNTTLIGYEVGTSIKNKSFIVILPDWYIISDIVITLTLLFEIFINIFALYNCNIYEYICAKWDNIIDIIVFILSVGLCLMYIVYPHDNDLDNLSLLILRIFRDVIRIIRCIWFFRFLYLNYINLETFNNDDEILAETLVNANKS